MVIIDGLKSLVVPIDSILEDPKNTVDHSYRNIEMIANSLREYGQRKPIVVNKKTNIVEAGNGTLQAAKMIGAKKIAAVFVNDSDKTAKGFSVMDNRSAQFAIFNKNLIDVVGLFDDTETSIGFLENEINSFFSEDDILPKKDDEIVENMEIQPFEHYDYIVLMFKNTLAFTNALTLFGIKKVNIALVKKQRMGLGRVVDGEKWLNSVDIKQKKK